MLSKAISPESVRSPIRPQSGGFPPLFRGGNPDRISDAEIQTGRTAEIFERFPHLQTLNHNRQKLQADQKTIRALINAAVCDARGCPPPGAMGPSDASYLTGERTRKIPTDSKCPFVRVVDSLEVRQ